MKMKNLMQDERLGSNEGNWVNIRLFLDNAHHICLSCLLLPSCIIFGNSPIFMWKPL